MNIEKISFGKGNHQLAVRGSKKSVKEVKEAIDQLLDGFTTETIILTPPRVSFPSVLQQAYVLTREKRSESSCEVVKKDIEGEIIVHIYGVNQEEMEEVKESFEVLQ